MRAREWAIASAYETPADHGIPEPPAWDVYCLEDGGLALGADGELFVTAADPVDVRR